MSAAPVVYVQCASAYAKEHANASKCAEKQKYTEKRICMTATQSHRNSQEYRFDFLIENSLPDEN
jgi:diphthamide synthase subunit DPH2